MTLTILTRKSQTSFAAISANDLLTTLLSLAILASAVLPPSPRLLSGLGAMPASAIQVPVAQSTQIVDLHALAGGMIPPRDCALYLAGAGLGLLAGAAAIAISAGAATPLVIGMALSGSLLPSASIAC